MKVLKRVVIAVLALVLVVAVGLGALLGSAFWGAVPLPAGADLPGGARLVKDGMVAAFVLPVGGGAVALIDCGQDPEAHAILADLGRHGATADDVQTIFLTHGHGDHTAGCRQFPGAEVLMLAPDAGLAAGTASAHGPLTRFMRNGPDKAIEMTHPLHDGETVETGTLSVRVFALPGHTAGSAAYLANGVLFLGDSATTRVDGTFAGAPWPFTDDVARNHAALRAMAGRIAAEQVEVLTLAPAHSGPQQGTAALQAFAARGD